MFVTNPNCGASCLLVSLIITKSPSLTDSTLLFFDNLSRLCLYLSRSQAYLLFHDLVYLHHLMHKIGNA